MNAPHLTPTLATCQALKEAGFPQDTVFTWAHHTDRSHPPSVSPRGAAGPEAPEGSAAPTLTELLAHLPAELALAVPHPIYGSLERAHTLQVRLGSRAVIGYHIVGSHEVQHRVEHVAAVEAAARLYLALCADGRLPALSVGEPARSPFSTEEGERLAQAA